MSKNAFRWSLAIIALVMLTILGVIVKNSPEFQAQQAKKEEQTKKEPRQVAEAMKRERNAWCSANEETIKEALHGTVIKIEDGYMRELPQIPLTTVTISYSIWKELNEVQRRGLREAVRCHSVNRIGGQMQFVDLNGVVIGR